MIVFALPAVQAYRASLRNVRGKNVGEGIEVAGSVSAVFDGSNHIF
jgi:hypothetical protein